MNTRRSFLGGLTAALASLPVFARGLQQRATIAFSPEYKRQYAYWTKWWAATHGDPHGLGMVREKHCRIVNREVPRKAALPFCKAAAQYAANKNLRLIVAEMREIEMPERTGLHSEVRVSFEIPVPLTLNMRGVDLVEFCSRESWYVEYPEEPSPPPPLEHPLAQAAIEHFKSRPRPASPYKNLMEAAQAHFAEDRTCPPLPGEWMMRGYIDKSKNPWVCVVTGKSTLTVIR